MRGVASEATLQSLVEAVRKSSGGGSSGDAAAARLQNLHSRAIKENTTAKQENTTATVNNTQKLASFGKQLAMGDERISSFSEAVFGSTTIVSKFARYVDRLINDFRSLSSVGASFNNSISDMVVSSVSASMTLEGFTNLIKSNSTDLAYFGGTVTRGAKFLGEFSRDVRLGIGNDFFAMGMTIQDVNEGLVGFMATEAMRGRQALRNDSQTQESASNYIRQLNLLSKLTGKQAEALEQDIMALQTDAKMRNVLNQVEQTRGVAARQEAEAIYALQRNALPGFNDALLDMSDGIAQSDMARALESMAPGITQFQYRLSQGGMSLEEYQAGMSKFGSSISQYSSTIGGAAMDVYREQGGFVGNLAQLSDSVYQFNQLSLLDPAAARREQMRRDRITATLGKFEQAVIAVRTAFFDAFINSPFAREIGKLGEDLMAMFDVNSGQNPFTQSGNMLQRFFNTFFGETGYLTAGIRWFSREMQPNGRLRNGLDWLAEQAGLVATAFSTFVGDIQENGLMNTLADRFGRFIDYLFGESDSNGDRDGGLLATVTAVLSPMIDSLMERMTEQITNLQEVFNNTLRPQIEAMLDGVLERAMNQLIETFSALGKTIEIAILRGLSGIELPTLLGGGSIVGSSGQARIAELTAEGYANGTNGFKNFGRETITKLHGMEAVVPRNTPAGDALAEFYKSQKGTVSAAPAATYNNTNQSDLNNKLDQLNSTMQTVASLLSESVNVQQRIKRGIGGMGTDLMRG